MILKSYKRLLTKCLPADLDQLGKIRRHHWKERLYISTIVKFESDSIKTNEDVAPQSREILQDVCLVVGKNLSPPPPLPHHIPSVPEGFFSSLLNSR